jgi:protein disulfide-isomerase A5
MKPEYMAAAAKMKELGIKGKLAAVDATKDPSLGTRFNVRGYPSVKYFQKGEFQFDVSLREEMPIVEFMKDPKEPPPPPPPEKAWSEEPSEVVHLDDDNFKSTLKKTRHALVMFYAPWSVFFKVFYVNQRFHSFWCIAGAVTVRRPSRSLRQLPSALRTTTR